MEAGWEGRGRGEEEGEEAGWEGRGGGEEGGGEAGWEGKGRGEEGEEEAVSPWLAMQAVPLSVCSIAVALSTVHLGCYRPTRYGRFLLL